MRKRSGLQKPVNLTVPIFKMIVTGLPGCRLNVGLQVWCRYQQGKSFGAAAAMSVANKQLSNPFYTEQQKPMAPFSKSKDKLLNVFAER